MLLRWRVECSRGRGRAGHVRGQMIGLTRCVLRLASLLALLQREINCAITSSSSRACLLPCWRTALLSVLCVMPRSLCYMLRLSVIPTPATLYVEWPKRRKKPQRCHLRAHWYLSSNATETEFQTRDARRQRKQHRREARRMHIK